MSTEPPFERAGLQLASIVALCLSCTLSERMDVPLKSERMDVPLKSGRGPASSRFFHPVGQLRCPTAW